MRIIDCKQGAPDWFAARLGKPTASGADKIITRKRMQVSESRTRYANELAAEILLGQPLETFTSAAMRIGTEREADAATAYAFLKDCEPVTVGFVTTDDGKAGASPDRLVPPGLLELKCPEVGQHIAYALSDSSTLPDTYFCQLQFQLWVCEAPWVDICSYYPGLPEAIIRVERNDEFIEKLAEFTYELVDIVQLRLEKLLARGYEPRKLEPATPTNNPAWMSDDAVADLMADRFPQ